MRATPNHCSSPFPFVSVMDEGALRRVRCGAQCYKPGLLYTWALHTWALHTWTCCIPGPVVHLGIFHIWVSAHPGFCSLGLAHLDQLYTWPCTSGPVVYLCLCIPGPIEHLGPLYPWATYPSLPCSGHGLLQGRHCLSLHLPQVSCSEPFPQQPLSAVCPSSSSVHRTLSLDSL